MKKSKFLILPLLCCMGLVGCKEDEIPVPIGPFKPSTTELERGEGSLLSTDLVKANAEEFKYETKNLSYADLVDSDEYEILDDRFEKVSQYGVLVVRGENGRAGFYSVLQNQFLISPKYDVNLHFEYNIKSIPSVGFIIYVVYQSYANANYEVDVYDSFGNRFYLDDEYLSSQPEVSSIIRNDKLYVIAHYNPQLGLDDLYYQYEDDGSCFQVNEIPEAEIAPEEVAVYEGPTYNSLFKEGWINLKDYGLEGHSLAYENGYYTVFNNDKAERNFYMDPENHFLGVISGDAYFQKTHELIMPQEEYVYDYSIDEETYSLEQYRVDLLTGEKTKLNYGVVFDEFELLESHDGVVRQVVSFQPINERLLLGEKEEYIVDKDFKLHDCVSGVHLGDFIKYKQGNKDRFYNTTNEIIYDEEFKVITYLTDMNPIFKEDLNMFQGTQDGKKGLVDLDGKVRLEFKYTEIVYDSFKDNVGLAKIDNEVYRVNLSNGTAQLVGFNLHAYFGDETHSPLYLYSSSDDDLAYTIFYSADKDEGAFAEANEIVSSKTYLKKFNVMFYRDLDNELRAIKYSDFEPREIYQSSHTNLVDGSYDRPIELSLYNTDWQYIPTRAQDDIYVKLDPHYTSEEGYYFVTYNVNYVEFINDVDPQNIDDYMVENQFGNGEQPVVGVYVTTSSSAVLHFHILSTAERYNRYKDTIGLKVVKDTGAVAEHPYAVTGTGYYYFNRPSFVNTLKTYYVTFTANQTAAYHINVTNYVSVEIVNGDEESIILPNLNYPLVLSYGDSITLRVRYSYNYSSYEFSFYSESYSSSYYPSSQYLTPTSEGCNLFVVKYTVQTVGRYEVTLNNPSYNIANFYADYSSNNLNRFSVANAPKVVTLYIVLDSMVYSGNNVSYSINKISDEVDPTYTISFSSNGGSGIMSSTTRDEGTQYYLPDNQFEAPYGYYFIGWKINNEGNVLDVDYLTTITSDIVLYAQWAELPDYFVNLDSNNSGYAWYDYGTYYQSSNSGSYSSCISAMTLTMNYSGTLSFEYMIYSQYSYYTYLYVYKNDSQILTCKNGASNYNFYNFETEVEKDDVITFYFRSYNYYNGYAEITNISLSK